MANTIPDKFADLFQKRSFGHLAITLDDGAPQVTPVWVDIDGPLVVVNSARGRVKDRNLELNKKVALSIQDPDNPYRYLGLRGRVVEITESGADDHINRMAKKYLNQDVYPFRQAGEVRVVYKIQPERVWTMG